MDRGHRLLQQPVSEHVEHMDFTEMKQEDGPKTDDIIGTSMKSFKVDTIQERMNIKIEPVNCDDFSGVDTLVISGMDRGHSLLQQPISEHMDFTEVKQEDGPKTDDIIGTSMKFSKVDTMQDTFVPLERMDIKIEPVDCDDFSGVDTLKLKTEIDVDAFHSVCIVKDEIDDYDGYPFEGACQSDRLSYNLKIENTEIDEVLPNEALVQENFFEGNFSCNFKTRDQVALDYHLSTWTPNVNHRLEFDAILNEHSYCQPMVENTSDMIQEVQNEHSGTEIEKYKCKNETKRNVAFHENVLDMHDDEVDTYSRIYHKIYGSEYTCRLCDFSASEMRKLLEHMKSVHNNPLVLLRVSPTQRKVNTMKSQTGPGNKLSDFERDMISCTRNIGNIKLQTSSFQNRKPVLKQEAICTPPNRKGNLVSYEHVKYETTGIRNRKPYARAHPVKRTYLLYGYDGAQESYRCTVCQYITKSMDDFKQHIKCLYHDKTNTYECVDCGYTAKIIDTMRDHMKCKHDDQAETYECAECKYTTKRKQGVLQHVRNVHGGNAGIYQYP